MTVWEWVAGRPEWTALAGAFVALFAWHAWLGYQARTRRKQADDERAAHQLAMASLERTLAQEQHFHALHKRRANEFYALIQGIEAERDTWEDMFRTGMSQAGVGQAWLTRDLDRMLRLCRVYHGLLVKHQIKDIPAPKLSPDLERVLKEIEDRVGMPKPPARAPGLEAADAIDAALTPGTGVQGSETPA